MATRTITLDLRANVDGLVNGMKTAKAAVNDNAKAFNSFRKNHEQDYRTIQQTFTRTGMVLTAGVAAVGKAAMDWETAWAGVQKTNDGTSEQMARLEDDLRGLAKTLPATHAEIAATAEAAGQLGVGVDDVAKFTETMIHLGETTNLSAEEAATSLARFTNITGTAFSDVDRLGSTIVALGNNFATTEAEILHMATRLAAAGTQAGLTDAEIMGLATSMSSVGIEAEAGGTAMTQVMNKVDKAVREGGDSLRDWAELAGTSAKEFADAWNNQPAEALTMLVEGLNKAGAEGESMAAKLEELGIKGIREADTMRRLGSAGEFLAEAFAMANKEFASNTALVEEAAMRYETTESKIKTAWNTIVDAAIEAGAVLLPVISGIAESVAGLATAFGELPPLVSGGMTLIGGIAGVALLGAGGLMKLVTSSAETISAWRQLKATAPGVATGLSRVAKAATAATAIAGFGIAIAKIAEAGYMEKVEGGATRVAIALEKIKGPSSEAESALDGIFRNRDGGELIRNVEDLESALNRTFNKDAGQAFNDWGENVVNTLTGVEGSSHILASAWEELDMQMTELFESGDVDQAAEAFDRVAQKAKDLGVPVSDLVDIFPKYSDALRLAEEQNKNFDADSVAGELDNLGGSAEDAAASLEDVLDALRGLGLLERDAAAAAREYEQALDDMAASLEENGATLDTTTEAGRANEEALHGLAEATLENAAAAAENGASQEELQSILTNGASAFEEYAFQLTGSKEEAEALTRAVFGIPDDVDIETFMSEQAYITAQATGQEVHRIPSEAEIDSWMSDAAFTEALATRAAVLGIPEEDVVDSFMASAARDEADKTTAAVLGIPEGASITSFMSGAARGEAMSLNSWLNTIDGRHTSSSHTHTNKIVNAVQGVGGMIAAQPRAMGGRAPVALPGYTAGGRLPYTGLGQDQILGVNRRGNPTAWVDDLEWIINRRSSDKFDSVLNQINNDSPGVQYLADGGRESGNAWFSPSSASSAGSGGAPAPIDYSALAEAMAQVPIEVVSPVYLDPKLVAVGNERGRREMRLG